MIANRRTALFAAAVALVLTLTARSHADEAAAAPPVKEKIMVWVKAFLGGPSALKTELVVNGKSLGVFDSESQRDVSDLIKMGQNTIAFTTTPEEPASAEGDVEFNIGPVTTNPKTKQTTMRPVLVRYKNDHDWKLNKDTGKYTHPFGPNPKTPDRKSVTHTYVFEYAGVGSDLAEVKEGAYVMNVSTFLGRTPSLISTLTVNGKPLGSFAGGQRGVNISAMLKAGENEIRLATAAVENQLHDADVKFEILGPMEYNTAHSRFEGPKVLKFQDQEGWTRDPKTGAMHVKGSPGKISHERVIRFTLPEAPKQ
jgi:hypothetical protein